MRKSIHNRIYLYVLYAALSVLFWFFDLMFLAWLFAALVILPLFIGAVILICNLDVIKRQKGLPDFKHTPPPPSNKM